MVLACSANRSILRWNVSEGALDLLCDVLCLMPDLKEMIAMRSFAFILVLLAMVSLPLTAEEESLPGLILTDLQLISQESLSHWTPGWTGPIQAATVAAWFAEHGYPALMRDFNRDGEIDELDTIELADIFGRGLMRTESSRGTTDVRLVMGLGTYVAEHYPDQFVIKIYDPGFPREFTAQGYGTFSPDVIPGIVLELMPEPSIAAFIEELRSGEGVILGMEEEQDRNRYLTGRSFLFERTREGYTPLDFAWAAEDRWTAGHQGQVLETVGKMDDRFYLEYLAEWVLVEFMLALSPIVDPDAGSEEHVCPENAIGYHVNTSSLGSAGQVEIIECVLRDGDVDIYIWTVTNIDFMQAGCGLCLFQIPNPGLPTVGHEQAPPWTFTDAWGWWTWWLPHGHCGLMPGESAVFTVVVPGPTVDVWLSANLAACQVPLAAFAPRFYPVRTTGPGIPEDDIPENGDEGCPDLTVEIRDVDCEMDRVKGVYVISIDAYVSNVGTEGYTGVVWVEADSDRASDSSTTHITLLPGGGFSVALEIEFSVNLPGCPIPVTVTVDPHNFIEECDETNNTDTGSACCK